MNMYSSRGLIAFFKGMKYIHLKGAEQEGHKILAITSILRNHIRLILSSLFVIGVFIFVTFAIYRPIKVCFESEIVESREVHVWGTPGEEWRHGVEMMTGRRLIRHYWDPDKLSPGVEYWPSPRHQFGLNITKAQRDLFARVSIIRFYGGISIDMNTTLLKPLKFRSREVFWYTKDEHDEDGVLQSNVFSSYRKSPFLLYWLRTFREGLGMEMRLSKLKIKPEHLISGGVLSFPCDKQITDSEDTLNQENVIGFQFPSQGTC